MILILDTETTGIPDFFKSELEYTDAWPRLVQIAWLVYDNNARLIKGVNYIIKPYGFNIPEEASKIHSITTEIAIEKGRELRLALTEFCDDLSKVENIIAHNLEYDKNVIKAELMRLQMPCDIDKKNGVCTMTISLNYCNLIHKNKVKYPTLKELHNKLFDADFSESHDAMSDVMCTSKCFWKLNSTLLFDRQFSILPQATCKDPKLDVQDIEEFYSYSLTPIYEKVVESFEDFIVLHYKNLFNIYNDEYTCLTICQRLPYKILSNIQDTRFWKILKEKQIDINVIAELNNSWSGYTNESLSRVKQFIINIRFNLENQQKELLKKMVKELIRVHQVNWEECCRMVFDAIYFENLNHTEALLYTSFVPYAIILLSEDKKEYDFLNNRFDYNHLFRLHHYEFRELTKVEQFVHNNKNNNRPGHADYFKNPLALFYLEKQEFCMLHNYFLNNVLIV